MHTADWRPPRGLGPAAPAAAHIDNEGRGPASIAPVADPPTPLALFERAFELAFFIHGDKAVALEVAVSAMAKLRLAATAQGRRLAYVPKGRQRGDEGVLPGWRTRVLVTDRHLLQRLVYLESEVHERWEERTGVVGEAEMSLRYVKHLVRIALRRHSFYVALGLGRLLHRYSTAETQDLYALVVQDPGRVPDDDYCRARKKQLMAELGQRFGDALAVVQGPRGEQHFETLDDPGPLAALVDECLERFTPWDTPCTVPERFDPWTTELPDLASNGNGPDADHPIEVNRIHALLHPACHRGLRQALGLAERPLAIPRFRLAGRRGPAPPRRPPPGLGGDDWQWIARRLAEEDARRGPGRLLRVVVDGVERARLDLARADRVELEVAEEAELVELHGSGGGLVALCLLDARCRERRVLAEAGLRFSFLWQPPADRGRRGWRLELGCEHQRALLATVWDTRRRASAALDGLRRSLSAWALPSRVALALAALVAALVLHGPRPGLPPGPAPPAPSPAPVPTGTPPARVDERGAAGQPGGSTSRQPPSGEATRQLDSMAPGRRLAEVEAILVGGFGDGPVAHSLRRALVLELEASGRFRIAEEPPAADALLAGSVTPPSAGDRRLRLWLTLVNAEGERLWSSGLVEGGEASEEQIVRAARTAVERLRRAAAADASQR